MKGANFTEEMKKSLGIGKMPKRKYVDDNAKFMAYHWRSQGKSEDEIISLHSEYYTEEYLNTKFKLVKLPMNAVALVLKFKSKDELTEFINSLFWQNLFSELAEKAELKSLTNP